jgi:acyl dehydratase
MTATSNSSVAPTVQGKYFEELSAGDQMVSPGRTITQADIMLFAGLSGDYNELHTNVEYAKDTPFGKPIAHGLLGLSIASGLVGRMGLFEGTAIAFASLEWKFTGPIFDGDTVHVEATVERTRYMRAVSGGMVFLGLKLVNQRGETTQEGVWKALIKSAPEEK